MRYQKMKKERKKWFKVFIKKVCLNGWRFDCNFYSMSRLWLYEFIEPFIYLLRSFRPRIGQELIFLKNILCKVHSIMTFCLSLIKKLFFWNKKCREFHYMQNESVLAFAIAVWFWSNLEENAHISKVLGINVSPWHFDDHSPCVRPRTSTLNIRIHIHICDGTAKRLEKSIVNIIPWVSVSCECVCANHQHLLFIPHICVISWLLILF